MTQTAIKLNIQGEQIIKITNLRSFKGFTLAEVLITLVIIGVISAMTIPTLMNNTQNQEYVSRLKKAYSTMAQATNKIIAEEGIVKGDDGGWATSAAAIYNMYRKHLSRTKDCPKGTLGCFAGTYTRLNKVTATYDSGSRNNFILADGTVVSMTQGDFHSDCAGDGLVGSGSQDICQAIIIDLNGAKGPNFIGKDTFMFVLKADRLEPAGCDAPYCAKNNSGWGCACKVLQEGAINYL